MATEPRPWPNNARDARDRSAEAAVDAIRVLEPLVMRPHQMTETERVLRAGQALNLVQKIARILESVGACTRP